LHTGEKTQTLLGGHKPCYSCGEAHEDRRHIITCKSLGASLHRTESWTKVKKALIAWKIPADFWITIEKGILYYAAHPIKRYKEDMPPEPQKHYGTTFHTPHNILQVAFRKQLHMGWGDFLKGRICIEWCTYIKQHITSRNIKKDYQEWSTKLVLVLWDHIYHIWVFRNSVHHKDNQGRVTRCKEE
jgi:hypothetical protein